MDFGEADRIITIFTPERGKLRVIAKGARKPLSRTGRCLEFFTRCSLLLAKGRELDVVSDASAIEQFDRLRTDLSAFGHASHMVELLNRLTEDRQENEGAYTLLSNSLQLLADGVNPWLVTRHYEWALLALSGHRPEIYQCVVCTNELQAVPNGWSNRLGGVVCPLCWATSGDARSVSLDGQKFLRFLDRRGLASAARLELDSGLMNEVEGVLGGAMRHVAERDLTSLTVTRSILSSSPVG